MRELFCERCGNWWFRLLRVESSGASVVECKRCGNVRTELLWKPRLRGDPQTVWQYLGKPLFRR